MPNDIAPFKLVETSTGKYSLLLTDFDGAEPAFTAAGIDAGGYAWEGIARHVAGETPHVSFDPEASMFCAYGTDRAALAELGATLAALYHDLPKLTALVAEIGPDGFDD